MRISDWSSDVCSSDLNCPEKGPDTAAWLKNQVFGSEVGEVSLHQALSGVEGGLTVGIRCLAMHAEPVARLTGRRRCWLELRSGSARCDRKSFVQGQSVSVGVVLERRRIIQT